MTCICLNRKKNVPADKEDVPLDDEVTKLTETNSVPAHISILLADQ